VIPQRFAGSTVFLTGTGQGQGRRAALRFAAEGANVLGGDVNHQAALETVAMADGLPGSVEDAGRLDVTDEQCVADWIAAGVHRLGRPDVLYNNAGSVRWGAIDSQPYADWQHTLRCELDSVFLVTKHAWPHLIFSRGCIINIASTAALRGSLTNARVAHSASKAGVIGATQQLAAEGAGYGIRANVISPGMIDTEGAQDILTDPNHPMSRIARHIPLGRLGTSDDVINLAMFLAGDQAGYITGANFVVDGGWSAVLPFAPEP
jgi:meso-butanediol dehydrogenase/(S,S)-butanediol dehydrogenase/diacetyl reductase